ncbi:MFS transporter [Thermodesulfobacteriota bacterium]
MASTKPESIWSCAFALLCSAQFLGFAQNYTLQPTLPLYVTHLGGSPFVVGVIIACFSIPSVLFRPFIGIWVDRWSEAGVQVLGHLMQAISILLCFIPLTGAMMLANGLRGIGWAGMHAGGYSLLATNAPDARRGEAAGYYRGVQSSATIFFPAVALWIIDAPFGGFQVAFIVAMTLSLLGASLAFALSRQMPHTPRRFPVESSEPWWRNIINVFDRSILLAALLLFSLSMSIPCLTSFFVLYAREIGISNFGWYFVVIGVTTLLGRPLLGRVSDKIGCARSLVVAFTLETIGLFLLPLVTNLARAMLTGLLYYMGSAIGGATLFALAMEKATPERRGRAMASFTVSLPLSSGVGGLLCGLAVDIMGYTGMFLMTAVLCASGLVLTGKYWSQLK